MPTCILLDLSFENKAGLLQASMAWARTCSKPSWQLEEELEVALMYLTLLQGLCKETVVQLCMGCHGMCCTCSTQCSAELVFFQLQEAVLGRSSLDEPLTFYNPMENKE